MVCFHTHLPIWSTHQVCPLLVHDFRSQRRGFDRVRTLPAAQNPPATRACDSSSCDSICLLGRSAALREPMTDLQQLSFTSSRSGSRISEVRKSNTMRHPHQLHIFESATSSRDYHPKEFCPPALFLDNSNSFWKINLQLHIRTKNNVYPLNPYRTE